MAANFRLTFHGPQIQREMRAGATRGLLLAAEFVLAQSTEVVPLDEGPLQDSGEASVDEASLTASVSYSTPYAVRQHEELDYRHAPGRTAKYLENPLNASRQEVARIISAQMRRSLG